MKKLDALLEETSDLLAKELADGMAEVGIVQYKHKSQVMEILRETFQKQRQIIKEMIRSEVAALIVEGNYATEDDLRYLHEKVNALITNMPDKDESTIHSHINSDISEDTL